MIIIVLAITIEALIEYAKEIIKGEIAWAQVGAIGVAILLAIAANADLYEVGGIEFNIPYLGMILTGIFLSRGSNYVSDLIGKFQGAKKKEE